MTVSLFKSTDTNAPVVSGAAGSLTDMLLACLVNGYGSSYATGTITSSGTNVSNNDTVTVDGVTYTFKTALTPAANEVLIGASAAASLTNLVAAINLYGTSGTTYGASTQTPPGAWAGGVTSTVITVKARRGGSTGNSIAIAKSAATLSLSGSTLSGGSGSDSIAAAGWSNPYNGNGGQRVFRGGSGVQHYYHFDDAGPQATAAGEEAQFRGTENASAFNSFSGNSWPTTSQLGGTGLVARKSATHDNTARAWKVVADDRTVYVFVQTGDVSSCYFSFAFGEIYSLLNSTDSYRSFTIGRVGANTNATTTSQEQFAGTNQSFTTLTGHYIARAYNGTGTAGQFQKMVEGWGLATNNLMFTGVHTGGDPVTGAYIIEPVLVAESLVSNTFRGRMRGMFGCTATASAVADGDTIAGAGAYTGRTFHIIKNLVGANVTTGIAMFDITGPWETN